MLGLVFDEVGCEVDLPKDLFTTRTVPPISLRTVSKVSGLTACPEASFT